MQNRLKSWAMWTAIGALIAFCAKEFFGLDINDKIDAFLKVLLPVLIAFGIVNDPTSSDHL